MSQIVEPKIHQKFRVDFLAIGSAIVQVAQTRPIDRSAPRGLYAIAGLPGPKDAVRLDSTREYSQGSNNEAR